MPEWVGRTIGKVRIDKFLAHGGMAEVYLGTHLTLDRPVAVKVLHSHIEQDPDLRLRFEREAKASRGPATSERGPGVRLRHRGGPSVSGDGVPARAYARHIPAAVCMRAVGASRWRRSSTYSVGRQMAWIMRTASG